MTEQKLYHERETCRMCGSPDLWEAIPLSDLPVASPNVGHRTGADQAAPASVWQCDRCGLLQLRTVINPEYQYGNFRYRTGISIGLSNHFKDLMGSLAASGELEQDKLVLDVGSNDGSLLLHAKAHGARILGVDPARDVARQAIDRGVPTLVEFFGSELGGTIVRDYGRADLIISNNTLANIDDLDAFFDACGHVLGDGGLIVIETQYALDVLNKTLLDVIYHEHVSYFALAPFERYAKTVNFELVDAETISPKGGSIRLYLQRAGGPRKRTARLDALLEEERSSGLYRRQMFDDFSACIGNIGDELRRKLANARQNTGRGLCYGASVGCAALLHYFELIDLVDATYDDTPLTEELNTTRGPIPVLPGKELINEPATDVVVLAWRYAKDIIQKQSNYREAGGRFIAALPDVRLMH